MHVRVGKNGIAFTLKLTQDHLNGTYQMSFYPTQPGDYQLYLMIAPASTPYPDISIGYPAILQQIRAFLVRAAPFSLRIASASVSAGHCRAVGAGLSGGQVNLWQEFTVYYRDQYANPTDVFSLLPDGAYNNAQINRGNNITENFNLRMRSAGQLQQLLNLTVQFTYANVDMLTQDKLDKLTEAGSYVNIYQPEQLEVQYFADHATIRYKIQRAGQYRMEVKLTQFEVLPDSIQPARRETLG